MSSVPFFPLLNAVNDLNSVLTKGEMGRDYDVKKCEWKQGKQFLKAFGVHNGLLSALTSPSDHLQTLMSAESSSTALSVSPGLREGTQHLWHWSGVASKVSISVEAESLSGWNPLFYCAADNCLLAKYCIFWQNLNNQMITKVTSFPVVLIKLRHMTASDLIIKLNYFKEKCTA